MKRATRVISPIVAVALSACAPLTDEVFVPLSLTSTSPVEVEEGAGIVELPLRLAAPRDRDVSLAYQLVGLEAQDGCQNPDFGAAKGRVEWPAHALETTVRIWVADDDVAERDERFELRLEAAIGSTVTELTRIEVVILDNDRSALLDAQALGVAPGASGDQSPALQAALDRAGELGRAVVVMAPGDYEVSSVSLTPGTTLSAYGVRWHRPAFSPADVVSLRIEHAGAEPSPATLVEGLSIDGRRDEQGPYREHEREQAHLLRVNGDPLQGGGLRVELERLALASGTGSGLLVGPDSEATVCDLRANELWRDALTLTGGRSQLRLRGLDATATQGTGLWLGVRDPGFGDNYRIDVDAEDVRVAAGDVEIEVGDESRVSFQRLTMTAPPLRLNAPGGSVRIANSVLMLGVSPRNQWGVAHDVEIASSVLVASETIDDIASTTAPGLSPAISMTGQSSFFPGPGSDGARRLAFTDCRFELTRDVPPGSAVYAIENLDADASVTVTASELGAGFAGWFDPECSECQLLPK
jgi:hypothetical protein